MPIFVAVWITKSIFFTYLRGSYTISNIYFTGKKHAWTRHTSRTISVTLLQSFLEEAYVHGNVFATTEKSVRCFFQPEKRLRDKPCKQPSVNLENVCTSSHATDVVERWTLATMTTARIATDRSPERTVNHGWGNVRLRFRCRRMAKMQAQLYWMQTQQGVRYRDLPVVENYFES